GVADIDFLTLDAAGRTRLGEFRFQLLDPLSLVLPFGEKAVGGLWNVRRCDIESLGGSSKGIFGVLCRRDGRLARRERKSLDAILDAFGGEDLDRADISSPGDVGAATGLCVVFDMDEADLLARRDAALIEVEPILFLGVVALWPLGRHRHVVGHDPVGDPLYFLHLRARDAVVVADIESGAFGSLLRAGLSDVLAEDLPSGVADDVGRGVIAHQPAAP